LKRRQENATTEDIDDHEYHVKLIARLANISNPEACFYAGMRTVFMEDHSALMP
jgi:hypothetical protein